MDFKFLFNCIKEKFEHIYDLLSFEGFSKTPVVIGIWFQSVFEVFFSFDV